MHKLPKQVLLLSTLMLLMLLLAACPAAAPADSGGSMAAADLEGVPEAFTGDPLSIAVIRNLPSDDHTKQFLDGARTEGEAFGFVVDTFLADNDDARFQELVAQAITKQYDGLIISHGKADYSYDMLKPAVDAGIEVVTFDTVIDKDGETLSEITTTFQDDFQLAELSLAEVAALSDDGDAVKVIKLWFGPGIPPLDRRETVYVEYEADNRIETLEVVGPTNFQDVQGDIAAKIGALLAKYPEGEVDAIWGSWDEMAKGAYTALKEAGRDDITLISIDVSNQDMNLMREEGSVWVSTAAVDPALIGRVNMRLLSMQMAGEDTPDNYDLEALLVRGSDLLPETNMTNLGDVIDGWGVSDAFNQDWMDVLRAAHGQ